MVCMPPICDFTPGSNPDIATFLSVLENLADARQAAGLTAVACVNAQGHHLWIASQPSRPISSRAPCRCRRTHADCHTPERGCIARRCMGGRCTGRQGAGCRSLQRNTDSRRCMPLSRRGSQTLQRGAASMNARPVSAVPAHGPCPAERFDRCHRPPMCSFSSSRVSFQYSIHR